MATHKNILGWLALAGIAVYVWSQKSQMSGGGTDTAVSFVDDPVASVSDVIVSATSGWKSVGDGSQWIDALNAAEAQNGIPQDLLARIAYAESHFRTDIIIGDKVSGAGALGLMQMMPQYFASVRVARPFTAQDTLAQINEAAQLLSSDYASTGSWPLAVAAYNAGLGNVKKYSGIPPFKETQNYVASILADVPAANA